MIKVILLPVKLLAIPVMLLLFLFFLLGKAVTNLSAYVSGLFLLVLFLIDIYCLWQQRWTDVAIVTALGVVTLILQFGAMLISELAREWSRSIKNFKNFIFS